MITWPKAVILKIQGDLDILEIPYDRTSNFRLIVPNVLCIQAYDDHMKIMVPGLDKPIIRILKTDAQDPGFDPAKVADEIVSVVKSIRSFHELSGWKDDYGDSMFSGSGQKMHKLITSINKYNSDDGIEDLLNEMQ